MVHTCIVIGCNNKSSDPRCLHLSWHWIYRNFEDIKCVLSLPDGLQRGSPCLKYCRICDECMAKLPKPHKPPKARIETTSSRHRYTREELRQAVIHDHGCYSLLPRVTDSSHLNSLHTSSNIIPIPKLETPPVNFCIEMFIDDADNLMFYTSFRSYAHLIICFNFLGDAVNHLIYPGSSCTVVNRVKVHRTLSPLNEFFLTLCRLRCGLMEQDLAFRFQISQSTVSRIVTAWINFLYHKFKEIPIWPSRDQVNHFMPSQFKHQYPNTRVIIDATELFIQQPSDPHAQRSTFSTYKKP